jgi:MFS family permease
MATQTTQTTRPTPTGVAAVGPGLTSAGLVTVLLGAALPLIDFFIVNVALPTIDADLHASTATLEMVVAAYGITYAVLLVVGGRLGDAFGRRKLFTAGLTAFTLTSLACGIAPTADVLVASRAAQGASAALMLPQVLSIIQATTTGEQRSRALGLYGATGGISTVIGQLLGGVLVAANIGGTGWRPIFLVNVPIGLVGLLLAKRTVPESRAANPVGVDRWGTTLLGISLVALLVPLMEGKALGWPVWTIVLLAVFPFATMAFLRVERRLEAAGGMPLLPPSVLRMPSMRRGLAVGAPFFTGFGGFMFVYAVTLQDGLHLGPLGSGAALTPMAVGFFSMSMVSSRLVARFGQKVVVVGSSIQLIGILMLIGATTMLWPNLNVLDLAPGMLFCGLGQGLAMTTLFRVILSKVPTEIAGVGSGVLTTTQQTFLALGVATLGSLFVSLSSPDSLGMKSAFMLVIGLQAVLTVGVVIFARRLPDPRD